MPAVLLVCVLATAAHGCSPSPHVEDTPSTSCAVSPTDATPTEESLPVALYVVLAIIVVFVVVIISLSVVVVLLYRKKCGRMEVLSHGE